MPDKAIPTGKPMRTSDKLDFVDAARGTAILMVIAVHTAQSIPNISALVGELTKYCQLGVQLFFVASAYTLCHSYTNHAGERYPVRSFLVRRYFRIAPLYYIAIPIYFAFNLAVQFVKNRGGGVSLEPYTLGNVLANVFFIHGFVPSANNTIVPGGWSIGTEMAFYLIFPILYPLLKKIAARSSLQLVLTTCGAIIANVLIQFVVSISTPYSIANNNFLYFNLINQLPVFLVGFLAYHLDLEKFAVQPHVRWRSAALFLFFSLIALLCWFEHTPLYFSLIPTISAFSFFYLLQIGHTLNFRSSILLKIGRVSFSMYVFHFLFAWGLIPLLVKHASSEISPQLMYGISYIFVCAITYSVAIFTQRLIEARGIEIGRKIVQRMSAA